MIAYNPKSWWGLIFKFHRSDTFRRLLPSMLTIALYAAGVTYLERAILPGYFQATPIVHTLLGFVISLLLVFRTNTAYERWWEGRKLWGTLVGIARNLSLKLNAYLPENHPSRPVLAAEIASFAESLKNHLRNQGAPPAGPIRHGPNAHTARLFNEIERLRQRGDLMLSHQLNINDELTAFVGVCGGCERIKNTPIPYSYNIFIKKFIFAYIVTMPLVSAAAFGYWSAVFTTFMFYVVCSLEMLAEEIESPFGLDANDLPIDEITEIIAVNVQEILVRTA